MHPSSRESGIGPRRPPWRSLVLVFIVAAVVVAIVILHIAGTLGPGAH